MPDTDLSSRPDTEEPPNIVARWEAGEVVAMAATMRATFSGLFADGASEDDEEFIKGLCPPPVPHQGPIESARCLPDGDRLFHSDMGLYCKVWKLLDPIPSVGARPGDLLFHCEGAATHGRRGPLGAKAPDRWPSPIAIMYPDESTYVAFLTEEHWATLLFPAADDEDAEA